MNELENPMLLNTEGIDYLRKARKWAGLISILALVLIALMLVVAAFVMLNGSMAGYFNGLQVLPLLLMAVVYFFPVWYLYRFSHCAKLALNQKDELELSRAMRYLWLHYRYLGILALLVVTLYAVFLPMTMLWPVSY